MFRVALKSALFSKRRLVGTALSVIIGIAFLAGTLVFTDTMKRTFDTLFADVFAKTDAFVRSSNEIDMGFGQKQYDRLPESLIAQAERVDGVADAVGYVEGYARVIGSDGQPIGIDNGPPTSGSSITESKVLPWKVTAGGRYPQGPTEAVLDVGTAKKAKLTIGSTFSALSQGGTRSFTLVGTARFGTTDSPGGATFVMFDLATAQSFVGKPGELNAIFVEGRPGVSQRVLADRLQAALGSETKALTGAEQTKESQNAIAQSLKFFNILLLAFAAIALFVGSFIIYNTFSIIVAQRQRENALLRAVGASRSQIVSALLVESVIIGLIASGLGFVGGIGMASVLKRFLKTFGIDIPAGGTVLLPRTAIVSFVVGVTMTVFAAVFPSFRASKVAPVAAMRDAHGGGWPDGERHLVARGWRSRAVHRIVCAWSVDRSSCRQYHRRSAGQAGRNDGHVGQTELDAQPETHGTDRRRTDGRRGAGRRHIGTGRIDSHVGAIDRRRAVRR
jgi:putative ABC transport system permease protein